MPTDPDQPLDDESEEVVKAREIYLGHAGSIDRVDAVHGPASGLKFVVLKAGQSQDPAAIAALQTPPQEAPMSAKTGAPEAPPVQTTDPADIAAGQRNEGEMVLVAKAATPLPESPAKRTARERKERDAAKAEGEPQPVAKADTENPDLDATEILDTSAGSGGMATQPGSATWEQIDADTAQKWVGILSRAKVALTLLADREAQEVAMGESESADNAWDLEDACCAVDYAVSILAGFAAGEQTEAAVEQEGVFKALHAQDAAAVAASLATVEGLAPVRKAGRVLSASNEQAIRDAVTSLQGVLSSLPAAAAADPVAKSQETPVDAPAEPGRFVFDARQLGCPSRFLGIVPESRLLTDGAPVRKAADAEPMIACYSAAGDLIGVCAADDLVPTAAGKPAETTDDGAEADAGTETAPATPPAAPGAPAPAPAAPVAKSQEAPAEPVAKAGDPKPDNDAFAEQVAAAVTKALDGVQEENHEVVKALQDRVHHLEQQPVPGGPRLMPSVVRQTDGAPLALRGQGTGDDMTEEMSKVAKSLEESADPAVQADLRRQLTILQARRAYGGR